MKTNKLVLLFITLGLIVSGPAFSRAYDDVIDSGYLTVGVYRNFPPFSYLKDDQPVGLDVELGREIARRMDLEFRVHWVTPDENLEDDLRNNVWKGHYLDKNEEQPLALKQLADVMLRVPYDREYAYRQDVQTGEMVNEQVVMFAPYQRESWRVAFDTKAIESVETMSVFRYHTIGVEIDSLPDFYLTSAFGGTARKNVRHYKNAHEAFASMQKGEVEAVMAMRAEIDNLLHETPGDRFRVAQNGFPSMGKQKWDVGMAVKSTYRQLGYAIEEVVSGMVRNGEMESLFSRYGITYELPELYKP